VAGFARVIVTIVGGSMAPALPAGARVRVDTGDRAPAPGRVMLLRGRDGWIVHRVLAVSGAGPDARVAHAGDASWRYGLVATADVAGSVTESVGPLRGAVLPVAGLPAGARARHAWNRLRARAALAVRRWAAR
jgi:hypothetical protein